LRTVAHCASLAASTPDRLHPSVDNRQVLVPTLHEVVVLVDQRVALIPERFPGPAAAVGLHHAEHIEADGPTVFAHACKMGLEGIVSKPPDCSSRSPDWLKSKNRIRLLRGETGKRRKTGADD
jgi:hypothetical protein